MKNPEKIKVNAIIFSGYNFSGFINKLI